MQRVQERPVAAASVRPTRARTRFRAVLSVGTSVVAVLVVWAVLVLPSSMAQLGPAAFIRIPLEGLLFVAVVLLLRPRWRRVAAVVFGVVLALLLVLTSLDYGFEVYLDRPFEPMSDWEYLGPAVGVLGDMVGRPVAVAIAIGAGVAVLAALLLLPAAAVRLSSLAASHRVTTVRTLVGLGTVWAVSAAFGLHFVAGAPVASVSASTMTYDGVSRIHASVVDRGVFTEEIASDEFADVPSKQLVSGLRGKDVLLVWVESYGRFAVEDSSVSTEIRAVLDSGTRRLRAAGFESQSAWLTSSTFGGTSWLAHSTLQSGLWVDSEQRHQQLLDSDRLTLSRAFDEAGWRSIFSIPSSDVDWPEGEAFYEFDALYDSRNIGYEGPKFSYAKVPDQYTLEALHRLELAPADRPPLMAEVDLVSSHTPWTPLPRMVPWNQLGDGSVFDGMADDGDEADLVAGDQEAVRELYGESIEYSLTALISFLERYPERDLVVVVLGDHQPHSRVSGEDADHDVPITVIAHDPAVMDRIADWGWVPGLLPASAAPVWRMDSFRDRFFTAFGSD